MNISYNGTGPVRAFGLGTRQYFIKWVSGCTESNVYFSGRMSAYSLNTLICPRLQEMDKSMDKTWQVGQWGEVRTSAPTNNTQCQWVTDSSPSLVYKVQGRESETDAIMGHKPSTEQRGTCLIWDSKTLLELSVGQHYLEYLEFSRTFSCYHHCQLNN